MDALVEAVRNKLSEIREYMDIGEGSITISETEDKDWLNNWKEFFHQFYIDDLLVTPSWEEIKPEDQDKKILHIDPGTAFGTGMHETTQLVIKQLEKLDELVKARFVEMFGDPVTNPKGYEKYKLENLARKISDGVHLKPDYTETGRPFLSVVNINKGVINFENCKYVSEDAYQKMIKSTHPERGDVLYTKVGATYGIPAYVDTDIAFCLYVSVCLIKPKREAINPRFLSLSMEMPYVKHQADRRIKGIGVPDLHLNQISEFEILCPPLKEQDIFIYFVERLDEEKRVVQQSLEKLELMKKALMQEYFG